MFITLTINTNIKNNPAKGWRMPVFTKKRTLWQKIKAWRRALKEASAKSKYASLSCPAWRGDPHPASTGLRSKSSCRLASLSFAEASNDSKYKLREQAIMF